jgi:hypothetical protein
MDIDRQILITGFESQRDVTMTRLAVIVAIERYDIGRDWNLNGPAQDALALIEKINEVSSSTPIHVFASLLSTSSRLYNAIASHPNVIVRDATAEHLVRFLTEELSVVQIDSFILFWGGTASLHPIQIEDCFSRVRQREIRRLLTLPACCYSFARLP